MEGDIHSSSSYLKELKELARASLNGDLFQLDFRTLSLIVLSGLKKFSCFHPK